VGDKSTIEWTDASWNPVTGCSKVSPGCAHCYAESFTRRMSSVWGVPDLPWTPENAGQNVILHPDRLEQPLRWKRPRMIFVNSMSDLFHEEVPDEFIAQVFAVMALAPRHTFQVLTKRPERMRDLLKSWRFCKQTMQAIFDTGAEHGIANVFIVADELSGRSFAEVLPNVWLGVSIENRRYVYRADVLRETPAAVRFISAEPLLGPLVYDEGSYVGGYEDANPIFSPAGWSDRERFDGPQLDLAGIDWLIVGGESGPGHRPMREEWVRDLRDTCAATRPLFGSHGRRTAFFFKQHGGATPKAGGRELDGRTWDEMPTVRSAA
jgi:protein gp37